jgi:hypothetical protein
MMAARFHPCRIGPICLARPSHGEGFAALFRAPRHRPASPASPRAAPPKHGIEDVFAPSGTHLPSSQTAIPSSDAAGSPFNAHSSGAVRAA